MTSVRTACFMGVATAALALGACKPEAQADPRQEGVVVKTLDELGQVVSPGQVALRIAPAHA